MQDIVLCLVMALLHLGLITLEVVMDSENTLHWMHISDLHRGQERTEEVWAVVRQEIHDDVKRQVNENGKIDLVIFSGDLAFKGSKAEFSSVLIELLKLWETFEKLGQAPKLFVVPGNHDLERPADTSPLLNLADILRQKSAVRDEILSEQESSYRGEVTAAFRNYSDFLTDIKKSSIPLAQDVKGLLPGDVSARFIANGLSIGLVGLNSAWTHLAKGDLQGKLDISVRQLNAVVQGDLPQWAKQNHINMLVTHHPHTWLCPAAQAEFDGEIFVPEYFDAHFYGHVHENRPSIVTTGAHGRRLIQVSSLFGLEKYNDTVDRRHGYCFSKVFAEKNVCIFWPRKFEKRIGGVWQVSADRELLQRDDLSFEQYWKVREVEGVKLKKF